MMIVRMIHRMVNVMRGFVMASLFVMVDDLVIHRVIIRECQSDSCHEQNTHH